MWIQNSITLRARSRGCHVITDELRANLPELKDVSVGIAHIFIQHTSAALTCNESWDPDVREDMETVLNRVVPEDAKYRHDSEGKDDMPAHAKCSLLGSSVTVPISRGDFSLGTWQGIWLAEFRDRARSRTVVVTIHGE